MRDYIQKLLDRLEMRVVEREVDPRFELAAVVSRSQKESPLPLLFKNVKGTSLPVVCNVFGSVQRIAEVIGARDGRICERWSAIMTETARMPETYTRLVAAPDPIPTSIAALPQIVWREKDAGPYISAGVFYARDPETGVGNLSFCRTLMKSDSELICCIDPPHDLAQYQAKAESRGEALPVAILIAPPPEVVIAACASVPIDMDEMKIAAAIRREAIPTRRCIAVDLEVPAETQIVIEGAILPNIRRTEGPFGEYLGFYGPINDKGYLIEVKSVTRQKDAVFHGLLCGTREDLTLLDIAFATRTYSALSARLPGILDVTCNPMLYCSVVKIDKQYEGHAEHVILNTFAANQNYNFACIVVDKDVDIHDLKEVFAAFLTRGRVDRRVTVLPDVRGWDRSVEPTYAGRLGIDATMPFGREAEFERARTPGADSLRLDEYFARGS